MIFLADSLFDLRKTLNPYSDSPFFSGKKLFFHDNTPLDLREVLYPYSESPFFSGEELFFHDDIPLLSKKES